MSFISATGNLARTPTLYTNEYGTVTYPTVVSNDRVKDDNDNWIDGPRTYYNLKIKGREAEALVALAKAAGNIKITFAGFQRTTWWNSDNGPRPQIKVDVTSLGASLTGQTVSVQPNQNNQSAPEEAPPVDPTYADDPGGYDGYAGGPVDQW